MYKTKYLNYGNKFYCCKWLWNSRYSYSSLDGSGVIVDLITASDYGTIIDTVVVKAIQSTTPGMIRFFMKSGGSYSLIREVSVPQISITNNSPSWEEVLSFNGITLESGDSLSASTQVSETFKVTVFGITITAF